MKTLFIDSSRKSLSVALRDENKLLFVSNVDSYSKHSNYLMNEIDNILTKSNLKINDIDNFVVLNGPGSFTGIRVGVTIAKTLAWSLNKNIYTLNNLKALKAGVDDDIVIAVIPDRKDNAYVGIYDSNEKEDYINLNDNILNFENKNITLVYLEDCDFINNIEEKLKQKNNLKLLKLEDYDYIKVIDDAFSCMKLNPHEVKPIYLKKIDAEK